MEIIEYENLKKVNAPYERELEYSFRNFLDKGWYVLGEEVSRFEEEFASYCGSRYCIGVASGLDALVLSLIASDLPEGSEILVPSNTYIATILSIIKSGYKPVLVEPDARTCNINPELIGGKITSKTRALLIVHLYGRPCDMDEIIVLCKTHHLLLFEDCAQSHGAEYSGRKTGTFGIAGAYSFYPTKNLGALGDAGAVITDDEKLNQKLRSLRNYGSAKKYHNDLIGINSRLDELQAAFLRIKLRSLDKTTGHKARLASIYLDKINSDQLILPLPDSGKSNSSWHIFNVRCAERDQLKLQLDSCGIKTEVHYPVAPYNQTAYKHLFHGQDFPISDKIHQTTLSLPISTFHTESDVLRVCEAVNEFTKSSSRKLSLSV